MNARRLLSAALVSCGVLAGGLALASTPVLAAAPEAPVTEPATVETATTATVDGVLDPNAASAELVVEYEFFYAPGGAACTESLVAPEPAGMATGKQGEEVKQALTLEPSTEYAVCLAARNSGEEAWTIGSSVTFTTLALPPEISNEAFSAVGPHGASLSAQVNPENLPGTYHYQYATTAAFKTTPKTTGTVNYERQFFTAAGELTGLEPNTEYDVQLIATNSHGEKTEGPVLTLKTLLVPPSLLPDNRAYEMVTPAENHNADVFIPHVEVFVGTSGTGTFRPFQASLDGTAVTYVADSTVGGVGTSAAGAGNQYLARRLPGGGWVQSNIEPEGRRVTEYQGFTSDLSTGVVVSGKEPAPRLPPLVPGAPGEGYPLLYACDDTESPCTSPEESLVVPQNPFRALFTGLVIRSPEEFGTHGFGRLRSGVVADAKPIVYPVFAGSAGSASGGLLFEANDALLHGGGSVETELAASVKQEIANNEDGNYLYDSAGGRLGLVDVLPVGEGGGVVGDATFGGPPFAGNEFDPPDFSGVISGDGSRVYWTDLHNGVVYLRVDGVSTVRVSAGAAQYWASAADGRYAFYSEDVGGEGPGLFRFDADSGARQQLVAPSAAVSTGVMGVIGASEDGEEVYFVAGSVLSGASSGGVLPVEGQPNLYLWRSGGAPVFIATLSEQDGGAVEPFHESRSESVGEYGDWQPGLSNRTAGVPAGGGGVVFMSSLSLPVVGFPKGFESRGAQEVYVFDAGADELFCVSCSSSGESPPPFPPTLKGAAGYLPISWTDTYSMPWISNDGDRVFFDSVVPLVPGDTNGQQDVYEWEREGTGSCQVSEAVNGGCVSLLSGGTSSAGSWFVGASANGDDVFIVTRAQLVPEDLNNADDLYDVRVDGVRPVSPPVCTGTGCQGVPAPPPTFATPPSGTYEGVGNFSPPALAAVKPKPKSKPLTRAQRLARALKACERDKQKQKQKRLSCEARAKKRYGVKQKAKRPSAKGRK